MADILELIKNSDKKLFVGLAGPGTGKTYAFKTIVESDEFSGKKILILSFINKLIDDLSEDLKDYNNVKVMTLHAFARRQFVEQFKDVDLDKDLDNIISEDCLFIKGDNIEYDTKFYGNNLAADELEFYKNRKDFYKHDEKELHSFNSIIYNINLFFTKNESKIPEYDLILVDEFQDFNKLEWRLIELLNKKSKVVLVGDDDQSLYHNFRAAKPDLIRTLFDREDTQEFTLDDCYRCPKIIVTAVNSLMANAKSRNYLKDNKTKEFKYPTQRMDDKNEVSEKYSQIDFLSSISGDQLLYHLGQRIINDTNGKKDERVLVIVPSYLKQKIYDGLIKKEFNVVEYALFSDEKQGKTKHCDIVEAFSVLVKRKTDNLALRNTLALYLNDDEMKVLITKSNENKKKIWDCLERDIKTKIEDDIEIFKKARRGRDYLDNEELCRFGELFNLRNIISRTIKGFGPIKRGAIEVEITTVMSSKGLSADFVYYVGIDNRDIRDQKVNKITDQKLCEFLVGITRAKKKLTLISLEDKTPEILDFIDKCCINKIEL